MSSTPLEVLCTIEQTNGYMRYEYLVYDIYGIGIIGYGVVYQWAGVAEIKVINVDRNHRGEGIGSSILQRIVEDHSNKTLFVRTFKSLIPWYEKFGFKVDSEPLLLVRPSSAM